MEIGNTPNQAQLWSVPTLHAGAYPLPTHGEALELTDYQDTSVDQTTKRLTLPTADGQERSYIQTGVGMDNEGIPHLTLASVDGTETTMPASQVEKISAARRIELGAKVLNTISVKVSKPTVTTHAGSDADPGYGLYDHTMSRSELNQLLREEDKRRWGPPEHESK